MFKSGTSETTQIGFENRNEQRNLGTRGIKGTDHGQYSYKLRCLFCKNEYGSNGTDIFERKCPVCQNGKPGIPF